MKASSLVERAAVWIRSKGGSGHGAQMRIVREVGVTQPMASKALAEHRWNPTIETLEQVAARQGRAAWELLREIEGDRAPPRDRSLRESEDQARALVLRPLRDAPPAQRLRIVSRFRLLVETLAERDQLDLIFRMGRLVCEHGPEGAIPALVDLLHKAPRYDTPAAKRHRAEFAEAYRAIR